MKNFILALFLLLVESGQGQCVFSTQSADSFEYSTVSPHLQSGTVYHLTPQTHAAHTGSRSIYMNFVDNLSVNTLVYERTYTVCPNQSYQLSAWFKQTFNGSSTVILRVRDANNAPLSASLNTYSVGPWSQWQTALFIPTTTTIKFQLLFSSGLSGNDLSMDDLELKMCNLQPFVNDTITVCDSDSPFHLLDSITQPSGVGGSWTGPSNLANGSMGLFDPNAMLAGTYTYSLAGNPTICPDSIGSVHIVLNNSPVIDLGRDTILCFGSSLNLDATLLGASYLWQDQSTGPTHLVTQAGLHWVMVVTNGCSTTDSIWVDYMPKELVHLGKDTILCAGENLSLDADYPNATYLWQDQSINSTFTIQQPGTYWVEVNVNGCKDVDTILVNYTPLPIVDLGRDTSLCNGETYFLDAGLPEASYVWQDGSNQPSLTAKEEGWYWVEVVSQACAFTDSIHIEYIDCEAAVVMPNVFTPNGDLINDLFVPVSFSQVVSFKMAIYNRWGAEVFSYSGLDPQWNGKSQNGGDLAAGVYFFVIQYTDFFGEEFSNQGEVTLMR